MPLVDSIDKIITNYVSAAASEPFTYRSRSFTPARLLVSPLLLRSFECQPACGGCCPRFSLDYLPDEPMPAGAAPRCVEVNSVAKTVHSDLQDDHSDRFCRHLNKETGRCRIHALRPFSCDFELIRFTHRRDGVVLNQKMYGRGWAMTRVDGGKGATCRLGPPGSGARREVIRKLQRLGRWCEYFGVSSRVPVIIDWIETSDLRRPLRFRP